MTIASIEEGVERFPAMLAAMSNEDFLTLFCATPMQASQYSVTIIDEARQRLILRKSVLMEACNAAAERCEVLRDMLSNNRLAGEFTLLMSQIRGISSCL